MSFTRISLFSLLLLFMAALTTGCEKDDLQITPDTPASVDVEARMSAVMGRALPPSDTSNTGDEDLCFTFNFPISFVLENGETITFENEDALADGLDDEVFIADFVYPFTVTLTDGTANTIDNFEGLLAILTTCYGDFDDWGDDDWGDGHDDDCPGDYDFDEDFFCFDFVYPVSFVGPDSNTVTVNIEEDFFALLESLDGEEIEGYDFVFPFTVITATDSSEVVITSYEDLDEVIEACLDFDGWDDDDWGDHDHDEWGEDMFDLGCYLPSFPLTLLINGEEVVLNTPEDFITLDIDHEDEDLEIEIVFPVNAIDLATGEAVTFTSEEELEEALDNCEREDFDWGADDFEECFTINFPLTLVVGEETVTVADEEALTALFEELAESGELEGVELSYPLSVTLVASGEVVTINNEEEWEALCDLCHDEDDGDDDDEGGFDINFDADCLTFNFPVDVALEGQGTNTVSSLEELEVLFTIAEQVDADIDFVYPLSVNLTETGEAIDILNSNELESILSNCEE